MPKHEIETVETSFYDREPPYVEGGVNIEMVITNVNTQESQLLTGAPQ